MKIKMGLSVLLEIRCGPQCEAGVKIGFQHTAGVRDVSQYSAGNKVWMPLRSYI